MSFIFSILQRENNNVCYLLLVHLILFVSIGCTQDGGPIICSRNGKVQGKLLDVTVKGESRVVAAYLGIPYAQVPQRFAAPTEVPPWAPKIKLATEYGPSCYHQDDEVFPGFPGAEMWNAPNEKSEDCLHVNVWTPSGDPSGSDLLPVMVWIYGGSFFSGTSALKVYDGRYLAAYGRVVVVSLNYRLGPLGFLPSLAGETPANAGLLDQNMALRWVKANIQSFSGDPDSITLLGESAGAASVGLHSVSPLSEGLFHRMILQSGAHTTPWAAISSEESLSRAQQMGVGLGCSTDGTISEKELLSCLREKTAEEIFQASWVTTDIFDFPFVPVYGTSFLPEHPLELSRKGKQANVDVLAGYNSNEGSYFALYSAPGFSINSSYISRSEYIQGIEISGLRTTELGRSAVAFMYENWKYPQSLARYRHALDSIIGHFHITCPVIKAAKLHASNFPSKNVFLYSFAYSISNNPWPSWMGVMHGYEIEVMFGLPFLYPEEYNDRDRKVSGRMVKAWINFAKLGNPGGISDDVIPWPTYNAENQIYVEITSYFDGFRSPTPLAFRCAFWEHYIPSLESAVEGIDEMRTKWALEFNRWSEYMNDWENARTKRDNKCSREQTP